MKNQVRIWAPATVANLNVGFDALGCALQEPGEELVIRRTEEAGKVRIVKIEGADLDATAENNVAGVAAKSLLNALGNPCGLEIELIKKVKPGSGLGSSASSAAGAVVGVNALLEAGLRPDELIPFALDGEELASGARHSDNVAPAVLGGLVLSGPDGSIKQIPAPRDWHLVLLHPQITIRTSEARAVLPESVPLKDAVRQNALFATFIAACFEGNGAEAALNMDDLLVGPHRQGLIPHFKQMREASMGSGARAMGIAGSGPSSFHIAMSREDADAIASKLSEIMKVEAVPFELYITEISLQGARVIS